jgi:hypothetical protein
MLKPVFSRRRRVSSPIDDSDNNDDEEGTPPPEKPTRTLPKRNAYVAATAILIYFLIQNLP